MGVKTANNLKLKTNNFFFFALAPTGEGISGSDRIFIELARVWSKNIPVNIFTTIEGVKMVERQNLSGKYLKIENIQSNLPKNFFLKYAHKIYLGLKLGFSLNLPSTIYNLPSTYLYSSSDFWMDVFPAILLKIRFNNLKWIATWFQTSPNPLIGFKEGKREKSYSLNAFYYWFSQLPVKPLIKRFADKLIVNNEDERKQFPEMNDEGKVLVLIGAVRLDDIENWKLKIRKLPKVYDCVFQGRFHPQKGVVELIDIWKYVVKKIPGARLAMIGDGPLMKDVKKRISDNKLTKSITLLGYMFDGPEKYKVFSQSILVAHPAFYDSGGMASAEAMAFGLPAVGFNLKAYESYYPKGMVKVETGNIEKFADTIVSLLNNEDKRRELSNQAYEMIENNWSWEKRANEILSKLTE